MLEAKWYDKRNLHRIQNPATLHRVDPRRKNHRDELSADPFREPDEGIVDRVNDEPLIPIASELWR